MVEICGDMWRLVMIGGDMWGYGEIGGVCWSNGADRDREPPRGEMGQEWEDEQPYDAIWSHNEGHLGPCMAI